MSYTGLSVGTGVHICLPYFEELKRCFNSHTFGQWECSTYLEDYMECHNKDKLVRPPSPRKV